MAAGLGLMNVRFATDYQLSDVNLISPMNGGVVPLMGFMVELNLFEDIYSSTISGNLVLNDSLGLLSNFRINGTEFVQITLRKGTQDDNPIQRTFRIFKVSNRSINVSNGFEVYTLNFCSEEFLFSEQYRISKGYVNTSISDIVADILINYVKVGTSGKKNIYIQPTKNVYDFVLPNKN